MRNKFVLLLLPILLISSCSSKVNTLDGYDNSSEEKMNTNLFYRNVGQIQAADPHVIQHDGKYYLYATNANGNGDCSYLQVWSSVNLTNWTNEGICYQPKKDHWCIDGLWAPEVIERNNEFYLFYSGWHLRKGIHEIGVAKASSPIGPFVDFEGYNDNGEYIDPTTAPLEFDFDGNGVNDAVIDASPFVDDNGKSYLYVVQDQLFSTERSATVSTVYVVELNDDFVSYKHGSETKLISPQYDWEMETSTSALWNEGPFCYKKDGLYYLFFSANYYQHRAYCVGYATSTSPVGPFEKHDEPLLKTKDYWDYVTGTGHCSIFTSSDHKETFIAYHRHKDTIIGGAERKIAFDRIYLKDGIAHVNGPTISPQPLPSGSGEYNNVASLADIIVNDSHVSSLNDGIINAFEDRLDKELNVSSKTATIKLTFKEPITAKAVMLYDSSNYDFALRKVDQIKINSLSAYNSHIASSYLDTEKNIVKIPCSAFIYEFDEISTKEIEITLKSNKNIYLNEIMVLGK